MCVDGIKTGDTLVVAEAWSWGDTEEESGHFVFETSHSGTVKIMRVEEVAYSCPPLPRHRLEHLSNYRAKDGAGDGGRSGAGPKGKRVILGPGAEATGLPGCGAGPSRTPHTPGQASGAGRPGPGCASQLPPRPPVRNSWVSPAAATVPALPGPSWGVHRLPKVV